MFNFGKVFATYLYLFIYLFTWVGVWFGLVWFLKQSKKIGLIELYAGFILHISIEAFHCTLSSLDFSQVFFITDLNFSLFRLSAGLSISVRSRAIHLLRSLHHCHLSVCSSSVGVVCEMKNEVWFFPDLWGNGGFFLFSKFWSSFFILL